MPQRVKEQNHILSDTQSNWQLSIHVFFLPKKFSFPLILLFEKKKYLFPKRNKVKKKITMKNKHEKF